MQQVNCNTIALMWMLPPWMMDWRWSWSHFWELRTSLRVPCKESVLHPPPGRGVEGVVLTVGAVAASHVVSRDIRSWKHSFWDALHDSAINIEIKHHDQLREALIDHKNIYTINAAQRNLIVFCRPHWFSWLARAPDCCRSWSNYFQWQCRRHTWSLADWVIHFVSEASSIKLGCV